MTALIVIGIIIAVIALIMLIPIGADVGYEGGELRLEQAPKGEETQKTEKAQGTSSGRRGKAEKKA